MSADEILSQIREKIIYSYADYSIGSVQLQVERVTVFVDYLITVFKYKDSSQIDPFLDECLALQGTDQNKSFSTELNSLFSFVYACSQRELPTEQSNQFIAELFPVLAHSLQYIYKREFGAYLDRMSEEQAALEKLDKSKSGFISIAAHELKTPLTLLEGYTAMMREIIEQKQIFDEHLFSLMDGMNSGSQRLREIINDMIDVSLIDNEMLSLSFQPTWVNKLLAKLELEFQPIIQSRMMSLEINRFEGDKILNYYDGERIFQALSNIVSNAIKYTPDGGQGYHKGI